MMQIDENNRTNAEPVATYLDMARKQGIDHAFLVNTSAVITAPWVRIKCQYGCAGYGRRLSCPPFTPTPDEMRRLLDSYRRAVLLHRHVQKGRGPVDELNEIAVDLERKMFLGGYFRAWAAGSGPCTRCKACDTSRPCTHADRVRPSMEACGIDVFTTARSLGLPINVLTSHADERDFYALVLVD